MTHSGQARHKAPLTVSRSTHAALAQATTRAERIAITRSAGRARLRLALWSIALLTMSAVGIVGLALTANIPGVG